MSPREQLANHRTARRSGLLGVPAERSSDVRGSSRRLLRVVRADGPGWIWVLVLAIASVTLSVIGPKLLGSATDVIFRGLQSGGPARIDTVALHRTLLLIVALYAGAGGMQYLNASILTGVVQRTMHRLRQDVADKIHRLPLGYVDGQRRGDLLSRVTNDMDNLQQSLQQSLSQLLTSLLTAVGIVVALVVLFGPLSLVALAVIPLTIALTRGITRRSGKRFVAQWAHTGELNGLIEETFTCHTVVKAFGRQAEVEREFREVNDKLFETSLRAQLLSSTISPLMVGISNLSFVVVCVVGGLRVASGSMTLGDVQAFIQYSRQLAQPMTQIASMMNVLQSGVASAERVFGFLDAPEITVDGEGQLPLPVRGHVVFDEATFSYRADQPLIERLSLEARPGQTVAIVGPTGAGKTTLVNLLMRFYELDAGRILLDGTDIATVPRAELRSRFGMVLQDTWLFRGTIRDNIAYGRPGASEAEIQAAAHAAHLDHVVQGLPAGYDTVVDDDEETLSSGEKQLLTIARAFLADPAILILDEATSSVDTRTEIRIQRAMRALRTSRTSFVIAHRLSTIRDADVILVMEHGRLVEQGRHDVLISTDGPYARLLAEQDRALAASVAEDSLAVSSGADLTT